MMIMRYNSKMLFEASPLEGGLEGAI